MTQAYGYNVYDLEKGLTHPSKYSDFNPEFTLNIFCLQHLCAPEFYLIDCNSLRLRH